MKLFVGLLLLATIVINVVSSNNGNNGDGTNAGAPGTNGATSNSSNNDNKISNNTITHHTTFDTKLNHLVVDRNTGRVSLTQSG